MKTICIITGASSGIGLEFAKQLDRKFDELWLIARRKERLVEIGKKLESKVKIFPLDLTDDSKRGKIKEQLVKDDVTVGLLVNNAGFGTFGEFASSDKEKQLAMIDLNVKALVDLSYDVIPFIKNGSIIQVVSTMGFVPMPNFSVYAATKAFVLSFSKALYAELKGKGIHVIALCPGATRTEFFTDMDMSKFADPKDVVLGCLRALRKKKIVYIHGFKNRITTFMGNIIPTKIFLKIAMKMIKNFKK
tara:strand:- start:107 stop:847 length:741 start_codon:yes stop_codon:yes gene_type:complete